MRPIAPTVGRGTLGVVGYIVATMPLCLAACYPVNPPLARYDLHAGYRYADLNEDGHSNTEKTFVILTFSGGGTRAAAFAYGVLDELRATSIGRGRTLLDEVDVISSVSGGSFTAAYYALYGPQVFFAQFPDAVLYRKLESGLILRMLAPWNWPQLLSPRYGRSDLADEYYASQIFEEHTFRDLPRRRPFILLNATDISRGAQFSFTQENFDRLCSDLSGVQLSRSVTASSAFPVAFTPLTFKNYGSQACNYEEPPWVGHARKDLNVNPQLYDFAKTWQSYGDATRRPYIHMSDGGLSDNIGLRALEPALFGLVPVDEDGWTPSLDLNAKVNLGEVQRIVVIVVDAKPETESSDDRSARPPGIVTVLNAAGTNPMENYSSDTVERFRLWFKEWDRAAQDFEMRRAGCDRLATQLCERREDRDSCDAERRAQCYQQVNASDMFRPPHPELYLIHVRFELIPDPKAKQQLKSVATRLQLPKDQVDALVTWARKLLRDSPQFHKLVESLQQES